MDDLESQEEDDPKGILFFKSMSWLGQIRSHRRDETWSVSLRLVVPGSFSWMRWETITVLVPLIRVPKRLSVGLGSSFLNMNQESES
jgi:hypothetical protein